LADIGCEGEAPRSDALVCEAFEGDGDSGVNEGGKEWETDFCEGGMLHRIGKGGLAGGENGVYSPVYVFT
jgi:hypothetical protein